MTQNYTVVPIDTAMKMVEKALKESRLNEYHMVKDGWINCILNSDHEPKIDFDDWYFKSRERRKKMKGKI